MYLLKLIRSYAKITLLESDLVEKFVKGGGKGGQKINKTSSAVQLLHLPTGIRVSTQKYRSLQDNRREARSLMKRELDFRENGADSKKSKEIAKIKKKKKKAQRRMQAKKDSDNHSDSKSDGTDGSSDDGSL